MYARSSLSFPNLFGFCCDSKILFNKADFSKRSVTCVQPRSISKQPFMLDCCLSKRSYKAKYSHHATYLQPRSYIFLQIFLLLCCNRKYIPVITLSVLGDQTCLQSILSSITSTRAWSLKAKPDCKNHSPKRIKRQETVNSIQKQSLFGTQTFFHDRL